MNAKAFADYCDLSIDAKENDGKSCTVCVCCHPSANRNKSVFLVPCLIYVMNLITVKRRCVL